MTKADLFHQDNAQVHKSLVLMADVRASDFHPVDHIHYSPDLTLIIFAT